MDCGVGLVKAGEAAAVANDIDELARDPLAPRLRLVRGPFELAVVGAGGDEDRELADPPGKTALEAQVMVHRARAAGEFGAVELDAAGAAQPAQIAAARRGDAVIGLLRLGA